MNNSIISQLIKEDNIGASCTGVDLNELVSGGSDLLSSNSLESCAAWWNVLALDSGSSDDMPQQNSLQLLLVSQQTVQSINWDLIKSSVGWGKDCERSFTLKGLYEASSLNSGEEGGELGVANYNVCNSLWCALDNSWAGGH